MTGELGYLSHQETSRMFERAFLRSSTAVCYSQGFNPRVRMSLPYPRTVGVESVGDLLVAEIANGDVSSDDLRVSIQGQMPKGCNISSVEVLEGKVSFQPVRSQFQVIANGIDLDASVCEKVALVNEQIRSGGSVVVDRYSAKKRRSKKVDLCQYIESLELSDGRFTAVVKVTQAGSARVDELLAISGIDRDRITGGIRRANVEFVRSK